MCISPILVVAVVALASLQWSLMQLKNQPILSFLYMNLYSYNANTFSPCVGKQLLFTNNRNRVRWAVLGWGLPRFLWKFQRQELKARPILWSQTQPTSFLIGSIPLSHPRMVPMCCLRWSRRDCSWQPWDATTTRLARTGSRSSWPIQTGQDGVTL